jgi:hypothetical protein
MSNRNPNINKGFGQQSLFESSLERILVVRPRVGDSFSGMLKRIQNKHLVFEKRNGTTVVIHEDNILSTSEVHPRRR